MCPKHQCFVKPCVPHCLDPIYWKHIHNLCYFFAFPETLSDTRHSIPIYWNVFDNHCCFFVGPETVSFSSDHPNLLEYIGRTQYILCLCFPRNFVRYYPDHLNILEYIVRTHSLLFIFLPRNCWLLIATEFIYIGIYWSKTFPTVYLLAWKMAASRHKVFNTLE